MCHVVNSLEYGSREGPASPTTRRRTAVSDIDSNPMNTLSTVVLLSPASVWVTRNRDESDRLVR
jgi:hypothetical protein